MISREQMAFVEQQVARIIAGEERLNEVMAEFDAALARFDRNMARQGIHPDMGPDHLIPYMNARNGNQELSYWWSKVQSWYDELAARGSVVSALSDAAWLRDEVDEEEEEGPAAAAVRTFSEMTADHGVGIYGSRPYPGGGRQA